MFAQSVSKHLGRALVCAFSVSVLCMIFTSSASAQTWNKKTVVTFNAPVEIPGVDAQVLPAGTYVFKLLSSQSDRHIVQIFNKNQTHVFATILAIPNYRLKATDKTVMTFAERRAGDPQAIRAWFYPGDNFGQEFVYPKKRAVELAKITNVPVVYIPDEVATNYTAPVTTETEPAVIVLKEVPLRAVQPTGEDVEIAQVIEQPPVQTASLPKTASELPLVTLMGFMCLGIGISMKALCAR
jgi:hypothetical protein